MRTQDAAGGWLGNVQYRRPGELSSHIDDFFPATQVRADTVDRGEGRTVVQSDPRTAPN